MNKQVIPINMIDQRRTTLFSVNESSINFNPKSFYADAPGLKSTQFKPIKAFLTECSKGYLAPRTYWKNCYNVISKMNDWATGREILEAQDIFLENILPKVCDLDSVKAHIHSNCILESFVKKIDSKCDILSECDRVIHNNQKLSARFNFDQIIKEEDEVSSAEDTIETLCELVDTYNIPINAKLNTALENILYSYDRLGIQINREEAIQSITEYFLRYNSVISDSQYDKICKVLENNKFISDKDINKVYYLFTEYKSCDDRLSEVTAQISQEYNHGFTLESKDFADSEDVKDIIKKYKADQNKTEGRFKTAISHIFTKKPEKIIDDTPNILEFIRNFGIFSTLAIHPVVTIIVFCVDKYIELGLKRKEAERVLKYFKAEKVKIENRLDKMKDGDKKDRLEEYLKCLDKSIDKLQDYRDNLYSEKELDRLNDLEEATNINYFDKIPIDDYYDNIHIPIVCSNMSRAIQLFKSELLKRASAIEVEEYEIEPGERVSSSFMRAYKSNIAQIYTTPDGLINVPLFRIANANPAYWTITDICSFVNDYLSRDCIITNYSVNDNVYIIFNYLKCIDVCCDEEDDEDIPDYSLTLDVQDEMATLLSLSESVDEIEKLYPMDTMKDLFKHIEQIAGDDIDLIAYMAASSKIVDMDKFADVLKDVQEVTTDPILSTNIMAALEYISTMPKINNYTLLESTKIQAESIKILRAVVEEAKAGTKNPVTKIKNSVSLDAVKDSVPKGSKKRVSVTTNLALASEMLKKKALTMSTKEKEVSRNVDINLSMLKKNIEKALTTDRREAIIKGSIIPSFSKTIKAGMVAGGVFLINPVVAAIGVIGALAVSKALTERERQMLLDEIDIELKAVEKEISTAESANRMKEYRQLLTYQRKLQREKQRIKYRLKLSGRDNIPDVEKGDD